MNNEIPNTKKEFELRSKIPWFTLGLSLISCIIFILIKIKSDWKEIDLETYEKFGAPAAIDIYQGQFWGVITNSFVHSHLDQFLLNLSGILILGSFVERRIGFIHYCLLGLFASIITSVWQLTLSTDAGLGYSGINYALIGYIFVRSQYDSHFKLKGRYIIYTLMFFILVYSYIINVRYHGIIATEAMVSGLIVGFCVAGIVKVVKKYYYVPAFILVLIICYSSIFYAPWSSEWHLAQGLKFHENNNYNMAKKHYKIALKIMPQNKLAKENLNIMKVDALSQKAYHYHAIKKYNTARRYYKEILKLDPNNEWAHENLKALP